MEKYIVDRIEEGIIIFEKEDMTHIEIDKNDIPFEVSEGNVLIYDSGTFFHDNDEENIRRKRIFEKQNNIFKNK